MNGGFDSFSGWLCRPSVWETTCKVVGRNSPRPRTPEDEQAFAGSIPIDCLLKLIYRYQLRITNARELKEIHDLVQGMPRVSQYIHEFIQNAEDAGATSCQFRLTGGRLLIANNGRAFTARNLYSICSFQESDKLLLSGRASDGQQPIGKFGQGFKAVFRICSSPTIVTWSDGWPEPVNFRLFTAGGLDRSYHQCLNELALEFPESVEEREPERERHLQALGYLFPVVAALGRQEQGLWEEACQSFANPRDGKVHGSLFILPLNDEALKQGDELLGKIEPTSCYFMSSLEHLEVKEEKGTTVWERSGQKDCAEAAPQLSQLELKETFNSKLKEQHHVLRYRHQASVPESLSAAGGASLPKQVGIQLAVPLDRDERIPAPGPSAVGRLFHKLPLEGVTQARLHFHVDAPFQLGPNRHDLSDDAYNRWLLKEVGCAAVALFQLVKRHGRHRARAYCLVPSALQGHDLNLPEKKRDALWQLREELRQAARDGGVFPAHDGEPLPANSVVTLTGSNAGDPAGGACGAPSWRGVRRSCLRALLGRGLGERSGFARSHRRTGIYSRLPTSGRWTSSNSSGSGSG